MAGFLRYVSVQRYVCVQTVIADNRCARFPPYRSQFFPSNFPNGYGYTAGIPFQFYPNGFGYSSDVPVSPLTLPQFYPNPNGYTEGYGYRGGVPLSRPQFYPNPNGYTQVWQEEYSEEVELDGEEVKGDSENKALQKCCKFLEDWFHLFCDNLNHFKQFLAVWFHRYFKQFLCNLEYYMERSTVFLEHLAEFMASLNRMNCFNVTTMRWVLQVEVRLDVRMHIICKLQEPALSFVED
nr:hypothetical protein Iba_chr10fCG9980 [Ipomoea batatas]